MVFTKRLREGVRRGFITCNVRIWKQPHVKVGGRYRMDEGEIVIDSIEPITLQAFRRLALDGVSGAEAAKELGLSVAAVYAAKSRVLARIRQEAEGLID
jgi:hypothetical protein